MRQAGTWRGGRQLLLLVLAVAPSLLAQQHGGSGNPHGPGSARPQGNSGPRAPRNAEHNSNQGSGIARPQGPSRDSAQATQETPASIRRAEPNVRAPVYGGGFRSGVRPEGGQHLPQWFAQHGGLPVDQQEQALRREPGFARLPPEQQQHLVDRLHRLNLEPPAQRQRMLDRNERFEALPPERQQEVRGAGQALAQMAPERRDAVRQAFRDLRNLPVEDRVNALNSARFQAEYSPQERTVLNNLLSIEPYQPR